MFTFFVVIVVLLAIDFFALARLLSRKSADEFWEWHGSRDYKIAKFPLGALYLLLVRR